MARTPQFAIIQDWVAVPASKATISIASQGHRAQHFSNGMAKRQPVVRIWHHAHRPTTLIIFAQMPTQIVPQPSQCAHLRDKAVAIAAKFRLTKRTRRQQYRSSYPQVKHASLTLQQRMVFQLSNQIRPQALRSKGLITKRLHHQRVEDWTHQKIIPQIKWTIQPSRTKM